MILQKFGVKLHSLQRKDIQKVRAWRNAQFVRKNMLFNGEITPKMQEEWYDNLDDTNVYLMIQHQSNQIGIIHVKEIDWERRTGEAGIFVGNQDYLKSYIPMLAIVCMMDCFLNDFSFKALRAKVKSGNIEVLNFNYSLGYELIKEEEEYYDLMVSRELYSQARKKFSNVLSSFEKEKTNRVLSQVEEKCFYLRK